MNAVILQSHFVNDFVIDKCRKMRKDLPRDKYEVKLLVQTDELEEVPADVDAYLVTNAMIGSLGYSMITEKLLPGSTHFPTLHFYLNNQHYGKYWFVEYDVEFTGDWRTFMSDFDTNCNGYDFMSCHVERHSESNKAWWWYYNNNTGMSEDGLVKGFNPICRYSNAALRCLDGYLKQGHTAHSEVMVTSCLNHYGYKIGDFGGVGEFVPMGYENKYYFVDSRITNHGTMRYRPLVKKDEMEENRIYHPIKY